MMSEGTRLLEICEGDLEEGGGPKPSFKNNYSSFSHYFEENYEILHTQAKSGHDCDQSNTNSAWYPQISTVPSSTGISRRLDKAGRKMELVFGLHPSTATRLVKAL